MDSDNIILKHELGEYEFDGAIDFTYAPTFLFDTENLIVMPHDVEQSDLGSKIFIEEEGKIVNIKGQSAKLYHVGSVVLLRDFTLQDFLDKNREASCIVFYLNPEYPETVFHPGNRIRVAIID